MKVLDALSLPPSAQVINAAGKFLIVAPNTPETITALVRTRAELDQWFLEASFGLASVALASEPASCSDFVGGHFAALRSPLGRPRPRQDAGASRWRRRMRRLRSAPRTTRTARVNSTADCPRISSSAGTAIAAQDSAAIRSSSAPGWLGKKSPCCASGAPAPDGPKQGAARLLSNDYFGFRVTLTKDAARNTPALRVLDLSLPSADGTAPMFAGLARRSINAYVPLLLQEAAADSRYARLDDDVGVGDLKTFEHLALDAQTIDSDGRVRGVAALGVLKGDIDNLGQIFATTLGARATFASWAALSRRVGAFFFAGSCHSFALRTRRSGTSTRCSPAATTSTSSAHG